jgi:predicted ATP-binding protein involved in virulence
VILEKLSLANFRGFEQIDLAFEPNVNVLAGVNGIGKSGLLQALAILFSGSLPAFTPSAAKPLSFTDDDVQHDKSSLEASAIFTVAEQRFHITGTRRLPDPKAQERLGRRLEAVRAELRRVKDDRARTRELKREEKGILSSLSEEGDRWEPLFYDASGETVQAGPRRVPRDDPGDVVGRLRVRPNHPQVIYFSTRRHLPDRPRVLPAPAPSEVKNAFPKALEDREVSLSEFMHWFHSQERLGGRGARRRRRVLDSLRSVLTRLIPEFTGLRIEERPFLRFTVEKDGIPLALNQLSDGERGILAVLFDITRRLAIANPDSEDPVADGKAIVLIDEIELHLHPSWQRRVMKRLAETFAGCQFIVTTHAPLVLGEVEGRCIRFLFRQDGRVTSWTPPYSLGWDSNRILEQLMDVSSRDPSIAEKLTELFREIDRERLTDAKGMIDALERVLGENDPDLIRARSLIAFLEGDA